MKNNDVTMSEYISKLSFKLQDTFNIFDLIFCSSVALLFIYCLGKGDK